MKKVFLFSLFLVLSILFFFIFGFRVSSFTVFTGLVGGGIPDS